MGKTKKSSGRKRWQEKNNAMLKILRPLHAGVNGIRIANESKKQSGLDDKSLTYGEIQPQSFLSILNTLPESKNCGEEGRVFVDLGCGTGLAVMCAALCAHSFSKCWGIEIVSELANAAKSCCEKLNTCIQDTKQNIEGKPLPSGTLPKESVKKAKCTSSEENDESLLDVVLDVISIKYDLTLITDNELNIEEFVDILLKRVGHKKYKNLLKGKYKTFKKFLLSHPDEFLIIDDNTFSLQPSKKDSGIPYIRDGVVKEDSEVSSASLVDEVNGTSSCEGNSLSSDITYCDDNVLKNVNKDIMNILESSAGGKYILNEDLPNITIDNGDIFEIDWWSEADVVYCSSLLFSEAMNLELTKKVLLMKRGSCFIALKPLLLEDCAVPDKLPTEKVVLLSDSFFKMSWQMARVFVYQVQL